MKGAQKRGSAWQKRKDPLLLSTIVLNPTVPQHPSVLPQGKRERETEKDEGEKEEETRGKGGNMIVVKDEERI